MMKFYGSIALIIVLSYIVGLFMPWWSIAIVAFLVSLLINQTPGRSFLTGFLAIFILWAMNTYFISHANNHILASKISALFLKLHKPILIFTLTGIIGGLVSGFSALSASYLRKEKS